MGILSIAALTEKWNTPIDPKIDYTGQTILITGANSGLGLETAKRLANSDAAEILITTRSAEKGKAAAEEIRQSTTKQTKITPLVLDMSSHPGVDDFMETLQQTTNRLHVSLLNAGLITGSYRKSKDGFEETIQVNTVSTVYLALRLLPILLDTAKQESVQTRLTFVSSRNSTQPEALPGKDVRKATNVLRALSTAEAYPDGMMGGMVLYAYSKLALEYAMRRMVRLPALKDSTGRPYVVINSVCPGAVVTSLARDLERPLLRPIMLAFRLVVQKPVSAGATIYLQALAQDDRSVGQMWVPGGIKPDWDHITSSEGQVLGDKIWTELQETISAWYQGVFNL